MTVTFDHHTYLSPYTWRYGTEAMRRVWSTAYQRQLWRQIWVALAEAQQAAGLTSAEQVADLRAHQDEINLERAHALEAELQHDLMAEVHTYAEQCAVGGGIIHLGATSMDIEDNADALRLNAALDLILAQLARLLTAIADKIEQTADIPTMAFTHLQPAEPTTIGYRLAFYAQDWLADYTDLRRIRAGIRGKGFKGAVGTMASYGQLLEGTGVTASALEQTIMDKLGLQAFAVTHQTYPRRQDWEVVNGLASVGMAAHKFAFDLRLLQSPPIGEWAEPFGSRQIGSSAMPFKRNPIHSENIDSLARLLATMPRVMWDNAANHLLERTLDDSGNRRSVLPEAFLITDEILRRVVRLLDGLQIHTETVARNFAQYGIFAASERLLMAAVRAGGNRQTLHEVIRQHSMTAWASVRAGAPNPLRELLLAEPQLTEHLGQSAAAELLDASQYIGEAPTRARALAASIRETLR
ncbi:MAG: adenylosuccinate lyase [Phototrophicaceae bacterium]|jgi:adenylosuccinate lyase